MNMRLKTAVKFLKLQGFILWGACPSAQSANFICTLSLPPLLGENPLKPLKSAVLYGMKIRKCSERFVFFVFGMKIRAKTQNAFIFCC